MHASQTYHLPIPTNLTAFALVLPPITGIAIEAATTLTRKGAPRRDALTLGNSQSGSSLPLMLTLAFLLVYETVVVTLAGTYVAPSQSLKCGLNEKWQTLFGRKDEATVRRIQDKFSCCGFATVKDRAWPFVKNGGPKVNACQEMFQRTASCFGSLKSEQQKVAGMLIAVAAGVFLWKVGLHLLFARFRYAPKLIEFSR